MLLNTSTTDFDDITITFTVQNPRPLQIEDKANLKLLIDRDDKLFYRTMNNKVCLKDMDSCHSKEIYLTNMENNYRMLL